jgi:membrane-bound ClpP family serine protease
MSVGVIYFLCFGAGLLYAIFVGLTGHLFGGDVDHHMDVGTDLPISPLSPTVISTFLTGFGGGGLLANSYFHLGLGPGVLVALAVGILMSGGTFLTISLLFRSTQAGSEFAIADMVGTVVQVVTPIPANGTGEVALIAKGSRVNSPARSVDGSAIPRNAAVKIESAVGNVFYVRIAQQ